MASGINRDSVDEVKAADSVSSHVAVLEHPSVQVVNAKKYGAVGDGKSDDYRVSAAGEGRCCR